MRWMMHAIVSGMAWMAAFAAPAQTSLLPVVEGPIPVTAQSGEAYRGSNEQPVAGPGLPPADLARYDYVQEEYFLSGTIDGKPYRTSLLVRRPRDWTKFSGLVGVETIHHHGAIPFWGTGREVWAPGGHAWVGVASQREALETRVKPFNPARYAALHIPEIAGALSDPQGGGPQDGVSQAIMTQVGRLLKAGAATGPFAGVKVRYLLMGGSSQTGATTLRYIQQSNSTALMPDGKPIWDGFMPMENFTDHPVSGGHAAIVHVVGEGDFLLFGARVTDRPGFSVRADGDAPDDRYRSYQIAGASHVPTRGSAAGTGQGGLPSQFSSGPFYKAALVNLIGWVTKGVPPPHTAPIERRNGAMVRDAIGNVKGGLRTPYVDVPTVRYIASTPTTADDPTRAQKGLQEEIAAPRLRMLYGSRAGYLARFDRRMDAAIASRLISPEDGARLKDEEAQGNMCRDCDRAR